MRAGKNGCLLIVSVLMAFFSPVLMAQNAGGDDSAENLAGYEYWLGIDKEAITTESGLQYKVLIEGRGRKPEAKNTVTVHYRGILLNGSEFDSSYSGDEPVRLNLRRVIKGWTEGLQLMSAGSVFVFLIPPDLAYGEKGAGDIPRNATLIFEIELFKTK